MGDLLPEAFSRVSQFLFVIIASSLLTMDIDDVVYGVRKIPLALGFVEICVIPFLIQI
jgi:hypothetical protein